MADGVRYAGEVTTEFNVDKRTRRLQDRSEFSRAVASLRNKIKEEGPGFLLDGKSSGDSCTASAQGSLRVYMRKRPLFSYEEDKRQFDVVTAVGVEGYGARGLLVSQCRQSLRARMGMQRELGNFFFPASAVFDDTASNDSVYAECARPLLQAACAGAIATAFMFGQTGSGKTFTMSAIQESVASEVFDLADPDTKLELVVFELLGNAAFDLLDESRGSVRLLADGEGNTVVAGSRRLDLTGRGPSDLLTAMQDALSRRECASTGANATSSRSHAVCQLHIGGKGMLTLVDLAGSERKEDSLYHDQKARAEGAAINASLGALKECLRVRALRAAGQTNLHVPYRGSTLTKVLRAALEDPTAHTAVIATATPAATDAEHTMSTLQAVCMLTGTQGGVVETCFKVTDLVQLRHSAGDPHGISSAPAQWTNPNLRGWLETAEGGRFAGALPKVGHRMTGKEFLRLNEARMGQLFPHHPPAGAEGAKEQGSALFRAIRARVKAAQAEEAERRRQVLAERAGKADAPSLYAKSFAPADPHRANLTNP